MNNLPCFCFVEGDELGELIILQNDPVEIAVTKDRKHVFVDDNTVYCGVDD